MQITNSVVCDTSNGCIYKQIKTPLVGQHAFPLTGFDCKEARDTFGDRSGIRSTDGPEFLTQWHVIPMPSLGTRLLGGGSNVPAWSRI